MAQENGAVLLCTNHDHALMTRDSCASCSSAHLYLVDDGHVKVDVRADHLYGARRVRRERDLGSARTTERGWRNDARTGHMLYIALQRLLLCAKSRRALYDGEAAWRRHSIDVECTGQQGVSAVEHAE
eukprot:TRINITY_DN568_c1_g1_i1.p1 TRINITY_DN568_c1_g1~~TRINITY_DN568_c1_g1_i1.p1  ORF type:complete len:128 (-),score=2.63 TRINITY_DN568_c1_g1_i1:192-575(-)